MRLAALAVLVLLAGCSTAEPVPVPQEFQGAVTEFLREIAPDPKFEALTCGSVFDGNPDNSVAMWADAPTSVTPEDLRQHGIAAGWQPQLPVDNWSVILIGPSNIRLGLRDGKIRAEKAKCSIGGRHQELAMPLRPDLTAPQRSALGISFGRASRAANKIATAAGVAEPLFPTNDSIDNASLSTCDTADGRGAQWSVSSRTDLGADADVVRIKREAIATLKSWKVDPRPTQPDYFTATMDDTNLTVSLAKGANGNAELGITATTPTCAPLA
ncbi:hypothetical protein JOD54_000940 [Actinokineospora baliensis]|uniref:hypothetical protein n=1 Tax=Actinokineospora baliensis TaxID=547056 RepID=UPI00195EEF24|nr:hypothetical protein [Actinokineospora baliensis]MBM7770736.1 hypothetical protein [Actinokineospora baliensis]